MLTEFINFIQITVDRVVLSYNLYLICAAIPLLIIFLAVITAHKIKRRNNLFIWVFLILNIISFGCQYLIVPESINTMLFISGVYSIIILYVITFIRTFIFILNMFVKTIKRIFCKPKKFFKNTVQSLPATRNELPENVKKIIQNFTREYMRSIPGVTAANRAEVVVRNKKEYITKLTNILTGTVEFPQVVAEECVNKFIKNWTI